MRNSYAVAFIVCRQSNGNLDDIGTSLTGRYPRGPNRFYAGVDGGTLSVPYVSGSEARR
jgi:hypothetical protein